MSFMETLATRGQYGWVGWGVGGLMFSSLEIKNCNLHMCDVSYTYIIPCEMLNILNYYSRPRHLVANHATANVKLTVKLRQYKHKLN